MIYKSDPQNSSPIFSFFKKHLYTVSQPLKNTQYENNVYSIRYIDGANKLWKNRWSREARGKVYWVDSEKCVCLKDSLQRGVEILTKIHRDVGIQSTQDMDDTKNLVFDDRQISLLDKFSKEHQKINGVMTSKKDGSLLLWTWYPKQSHQYDIVSMLLTVLPNTSMIIKVNDGIWIPATKSTFIIGEDMIDYLITSLGDVLGVFRPPASMNVKDAWLRPDFQTKLISWLSNMLSSLPQWFKNGTITFDYEMICKNRTTYTGCVHNELVTNYNSSDVSFLGIHYNSRYYPHFLFKSTKEIVHHPVYQYVSDTSEVFATMNFINNTMLHDASALGSGFDAEGWVYLDYDTDIDLCEYLKDDCDWNKYTSPDYSKLKSQIYYLCQKVNNNTIKTIINLPDGVGVYFPIVTKIKDFYSTLDTNVNDFFKLVSRDLQTELSIDSVTVKSLSDTAKNHISKYHELVSDNRCKDIAHKIILNTPSEKLHNMFCDSFYKVFGGKVNIKKKSSIVRFAVYLLTKNNLYDTLSVDDTILCSLYHLVLV